MKWLKTSEIKSRKLRLITNFLTQPRQDVPE